MVDAQDAAVPQPPAFRASPRIYAGLAALVLSFAMPVFVLIVPFLGLSTRWSTLLGAGLLVGGPEVVTLIAVALLGKDALYYFTARVKQTLWKRVFQTRVSRFQYYVGLVVFMVSIVPLYVYGYLPGVLPESGRVPILASADLLFIVSMFIMGGEFWEKVQRIFIWEGKG
jgi:hypothetical protein